MFEYKLKCQDLSIRNECPRVDLSPALSCFSSFLLNSGKSYSPSVHHCRSLPVPGSWPRHPDPEHCAHSVTAPKASRAQGLPRDPPPHPCCCCTSDQHNNIPCTCGWGATFLGQTNRATERTLLPVSWREAAEELSLCWSTDSSPIPALCKI